MEEKEEKEEEEKEDEEEGLLLEVGRHVCRLDGQNGECAEAGIEVPGPTDSCRNVVARVVYVVRHDGADGIESVDAYVELADAADSRRAGTPLSQRFEYRHFWSSGENTTDEVRVRSGNPGYLPGRPVPVGDGLDLKAPRILHLGTLSVFAPGPNGRCSLKPDTRTEVGFGDNLRVGCSVYLTRSELSEGCARLKNRTLGMLLGPAGMGDRYVATFGNSEPGKPGDWVRVIHTGPPDLGYKKQLAGRCSNLVTSLHIEVLYSNVGSFANPQAKIVGVMYKFGKPRDVVYMCVGLACSRRDEPQRVEVASSVSFVDVSRPALRQFAEYPVIEAKFPHDFFYPFVSGGGGGGGGSTPPVCGPALASSLLACLLLYLRP